MLEISRLLHKYLCVSLECSSTGNNDDPEIKNVNIPMTWFRRCSETKTKTKTNDQKEGPNRNFTIQVFKNTDLACQKWKT